MAESRGSGPSLLLGLDLGGSAIKGLLVTSRGKILARSETETRAEAGVDEVRFRIASLARTLMSLAAVEPREVLGIGLGVPGTVNRARDGVVFAPNLHWKSVPVVAPLSHEVGLPVYLDNDANLATLGEQTFGAGRGVRDLIMLTLGTGIGGGIVIDGKLLRGRNNNAGEIGHTTIDINGPRCNCGNYGCFEVYASTTALVERVREMLRNRTEVQDGTRSPLQEIVAQDPARLNGALIFHLAREKDPIAENAISALQKFVAIGIANLVNIFNPEKIILGGGISGAGDLLVVPIREFVRERVPEAGFDGLSIEIGKLGPDAGAMGAAALVRLEARARRAVGARGVVGGE